MGALDDQAVKIQIDAYIRGVKQSRHFVWLQLGQRRYRWGLCPKRAERRRNCTFPFPDRPSGSRTRHFQRFWCLSSRRSHRMSRSSVDPCAPIDRCPDFVQTPLRVVQPSAVRIVNRLMIAMLALFACAPAPRRRRSSAGPRWSGSSAPTTRRRPTRSICLRPIHPSADGACSWRSIRRRGARSWSRNIQAAAEQYGYIVAASNNSRNGPYDVSTAAAQAMSTDVGRRFSIDPQRVYLAGMSGGARVATGIALGKNKSPGSSRRAPGIRTASRATRCRSPSSAPRAPRISTTSRCGCSIGS